MDKRFFKADDGARYWVVAETMDDARQTLHDAGVEWARLPKWVEMTNAEAAELGVNTNEDGRGRGHISLAECDIGEWFTSEW